MPQNNRRHLRSERISDLPCHEHGIRWSEVNTPFCQKIALGPWGKPMVKAVIHKTVGLPLAKWRFADGLLERAFDLASIERSSITTTWCGFTNIENGWCDCKLGFAKNHLSEILKYYPGVSSVAVECVGWPYSWGSWPCSGKYGVEKFRETELILVEEFEGLR